MMAEDHPAIIRLDRHTPEHLSLLGEIRDTFSLNEADFEYEFLLRESLCRIWLRFFKLSDERRGMNPGKHSLNETVKRIMLYIHEHCGEKLSVEQISQEAHISPRTCYRMFREALNMSPNEYLRSYRIRSACRLLVKSTVSITQIAMECGFGSTSYFGRMFREVMGISPSDYRRLAQK